MANLSWWWRDMDVCVCMTCIMNIIIFLFPNHFFTVCCSYGSVTVSSGGFTCNFSLSFVFLSLPSLHFSSALQLAFPYSIQLRNPMHSIRKCNCVDLFHWFSFPLKLLWLSLLRFFGNYIYFKRRTTKQFRDGLRDATSTQHRKKVHIIFRDTQTESNQKLCNHKAYSFRKTSWLLVRKLGLSK